MQGTVQWIGVRPERREPMVSVQSVMADEENGLSGDHATKPDRQVTLISREGLDAAAADLGRESLDPSLTRRNIVISGLDFPMEPGTQLHIGEAVLEVTGASHGCKRMDENIGTGGLKALANRAGLTSRVVTGGKIAVGDPVTSTQS